MSEPIKLRIIVDPLGDEQSAFHCDIAATIDDIQAVDEKHGMDDFMEKFVKPALMVVLDQFQQPYTDVEDLLRKTETSVRENNVYLPRSIEFYRQKFEAARKHGGHWLPGMPT